MRRSTSASAARRNSRCFAAPGTTHGRQGSTLRRRAHGHAHPKRPYAPRGNSRAGFGPLCRGASAGAVDGGKGELRYQCAQHHVHAGLGRGSLRGIADAGGRPLAAAAAGPGACFAGGVVTKPGFPETFPCGGGDCELRADERRRRPEVVAHHSGSAVANEANARLVEAVRNFGVRFLARFASRPRPLGPDFSEPTLVGSRVQPRRRSSPAATKPPSARTRTVVSGSGMELTGTTSKVRLSSPTFQSSPHSNRIVPAKARLGANVECRAPMKSPSIETGPLAA